MLICPLVHAWTRETAFVICQLWVSVDVVCWDSEDKQRLRLCKAAVWERKLPEPRPRGNVIPAPEQLTYSELLPLLSASLPAEDRKVEPGAIWHESLSGCVNKTIVICVWVGGAVDPWILQRKLAFPVNCFRLSPTCSLGLWGTTPVSSNNSRTIRCVLPGFCRSIKMFTNHG